MKKILFFLFFFLSISGQAFSNTISSYCDVDVSEKNIEKINNLLIKKIEIDINEYRKWTVNSIRIITSNFRFIPQKYKKRFQAKILITYENDIRCILEGRVRHSGDAKDHIALQGNSISQSLDVILDIGHIRGITRFKLFRPGVRGKAEDVIIQTEILRNLNYLAPRTVRVNTRINNTEESAMLFQEKASKELLEFNKRREGPILEGDQRFFFKLVENIPDNNQSNWKVGTPLLRSKSIKAMLAKQTNSNLIKKNEYYKKMSYNALTNLNLIYLYYTNRFQDEKNNFNFFDYDLDNQLLGFFNRDNVLKLDIYNLLMQSTNSQHALSSSNRKFYWNSIENYFEPINYDSNPHIDGLGPTTTTASFRLPVSPEFHEAFMELEKKLKSLNLNHIYSNLIKSGVDLTKEDVNKKINKILLNLANLKKVYLNIQDNVLKHNEFKEINDIFSKFYKTLEEIDSNVYLVKYDANHKKLEKCKIYLKNCVSLSLSAENIADLLEGELVLNGEEYQYVGQNTKSTNFVQAYSIQQTNFQNFKIFYSNGIEVKYDLEKNVLDINQNKIGARAFILGGELKDITINFNGFKGETRDLSKHLIDARGLTGCLSLINVNLKNIVINSSRSNCEDSVNLINVTGSIKTINIQNSFMDGLDVDFSNIVVNQANIKNSKNDCLDLSFGQYILKKINLSDCGDKGLSVGEKSSVELDYIKIKNSNIGIASKDSSITKLKNANLENLKICVTAYNKKQEFYGGFLKIKNINCKNYDEKVEIDNYSKIIIEKEI